MTQPPLSQTIQALEALLGTPLFPRTKRSVTLTPAGAALLPEARRILQQAARCPTWRAARPPASPAGCRSPSCRPPTTACCRLFCANSANAYPQVQIDLREATTDVQLEDAGAGAHRCRPADPAAARPAKD